MKTYHVTYHYLASGMEGKADTRDFGHVAAESELDALEYIVNNVDTKRKKYSLEKDRSYRHWGLSAKRVPNVVKIVHKIKDKLC